MLKSSLHDAESKASTAITNLGRVQAECERHTRVS